MNRCTDYQLEISALLDGESDPRTALELLDHVGRCGSCGVFVREIRAAQATIDVVYPVSDPVRASGSTPSPKRRITPMPRWAWALAATIVVAVGTVLLSEGDPSGSIADAREDSEIVVRLGEHSGTMSDDRFMELATELLSADRLYRDQMYLVLEAVRTGEPGDERGTFDEAIGSGGALGGGVAGLTSNALD